MLRILLADDHALIRGGLRTLLGARREFFICGEADDGINAVKLAIQTQPAVVVMNINLPDINGIEATRQIRKASPDTEILIFTDENNEDLMREALKAGARGYLLKAASDDQIIAAIETVARHRGYYSGFLAEKLLRSEHNDSQLTMREREILRLVAEGRRSKEIAQMLGISLRTVETHRAASMRKLNLHSVAQVIGYAVREKLIQM
jgi:DNA-binding NarL/FixJ family response regulator